MPLFTIGHKVENAKTEKISKGWGAKVMASGTEVIKQKKSMEKNLICTRKKENLKIAEEKLVFESSPTTDAWILNTEYWRLFKVKAGSAKIEQVTLTATHPKKFLNYSIYNKHVQKFFDQLATDTSSLELIWRKKFFR